jgi:hypothetical protein
MNNDTSIDFDNYFKMKREETKINFTPIIMSTGKVALKYWLLIGILSLLYYLVSGSQIINFLIFITIATFVLTILVYVLKIQGVADVRTTQAYMGGASNYSRDSFNATYGITTNKNDYHPPFEFRLGLIAVISFLFLLLIHLYIL